MYDDCAVVGVAAALMECKTYEVGPVTNCVGVTTAGFNS